MGFLLSKISDYSDYLQNPSVASSKHKKRLERAFMVFWRHLLAQFTDCFIKGWQFIHLIDIPKPFLPMDAVKTSTMAICTQWHWSKPLALIDFVTFARGWCLANDTGHALNSLNVALFFCIGFRFVFALHYWVAFISIRALYCSVLQTSILACAAVISHLYRSSFSTACLMPSRISM